ncbi:hypothetical protein ACOMHN_059739 [Nucella lapillus]
MSSFPLFILQSRHLYFLSFYPSPSPSTRSRHFESFFWLPFIQSFLFFLGASFLFFFLIRGIVRIFVSIPPPMPTDFLDSACRGLLPGTHVCEVGEGRVVQGVVGV